jgi:Protein of unknown function (DUF2971)
LRLHIPARTRTQEQLHFLIMQPQIYVASLSSEGDDLSQWRAYGGVGTGYAIGLDGGRIARLAVEQRFVLARCIYDPAEHAEWVNEIVEQSLAEMENDGNEGVEYGRAMPGDNLLYRLIQFSPLMKHPKFRSENEWRLIMEPPGPEQHEELAFREGRFTLIPRFRFKLQMAGDDPIPLALNKLVVGPSAEQALAIRAAHLALLHYGRGADQHKTLVTWSDIPNRNWM